MSRFDPGTATCEVFTFREGVLAVAGHDLKLRATRFELEATRESVRARFEAASLRAVAAVRGGGVSGILSLHGRGLQGDFAVRQVEGRAVAEVQLDVRRFGIRPYTAMLGALRVQPRVLVVATTP